MYYVVGVAALALAVRAVASGCTADEIALVNGPCAPVDCRQKYGYTRNVFDKTLRLCVAAAECSTNEVYNPHTNTCGGASAPAQPGNYTSPLPPVDGGGGGGDTTSGGGLPGSAAPQLECGAHGHPSAGNDTCVCDAGWRTSDEQDAFARTYCNVRSTDNAQSVGAGSSNGTSSGDGTSTAPRIGQLEGNMGIAAVSITCLAVLIACAAAGYYAARARRVRRARRAREEEVAAVRKHELTSSTHPGSSSLCASMTSNTRGAGPFEHRVPPLNLADQLALYAAVAQAWAPPPEQPRGWAHGALFDGWAAAHEHSRTAPPGRAHGGHAPGEPRAAALQTLDDRAMVALLRARAAQHGPPAASSSQGATAASPAHQPSNGDLLRSAANTFSRLELEQARGSALAKMIESYSENAERAAFLAQLGQIHGGGHWARAPLQRGEDGTDAPSGSALAVRRETRPAMANAGDRDDGFAPFGDSLTA
ncbi:hypothetical protein KFE25_002938 [Diacronema lutheri]|uniref:Uncharacterized protein n=1 Tax=Diacronema lutheri TaxID=2081491 RepID=A0A8J5XJ59_DIALT|nr:hypothetical protein KFE25_002938 [Diacronema lutheri]